MNTDDESVDCKDDANLPIEAANSANKNMELGIQIEPGNEIDSINENGDTDDKSTVTPDARQK